MKKAPKKRLRLIVLSLTVLLSSVVAIPASQAAIIFSSAWGSSGIGFGLNNAYWSAQRIYAGSNQTITKIEIQSSSSAYTLKIRGESASKPGSPLTTFTYSSASGGIQTFTGSFSAVSGTYYWISLENVTAAVSVNATQTINDSSSSGWTSGGAVLSTTDSGATWSNASVGGYNYFSLRLSTSSTLLTTPSAPIVSNIQNTSVSVSETSTTANAVTYVVRLYQTNGTTLVESKTVSSITTATTFSNLTPGTNYKVAVTAIADGINFDNSTESALTSFTTSALSSISISGTSNLIYRTSAVVTLNVTGGDGKVTLLANGKRVAGCISKSTASLVFACTYRPTMRGNLVLTAQFRPTNVALSSSTASTQVNVKSRSNSR